jgi:hypothetical protein
MWAQREIDMNHNHSRNSILAQQQVVLEAFKGMSGWTEKSRTAARKQIDSLSFHYLAIKRSPSEKPSDGNELSAILTSATSTAKEADQKQDVQSNVIQSQLIALKESVMSIDVSNRHDMEGLNVNHLFLQVDTSRTVTSNWNEDVMRNNVTR